MFIRVRRARCPRDRSQPAANPPYRSGQFRPQPERHVQGLAPGPSVAIPPHRSGQFRRDSAGERLPEAPGVAIPPYRSGQFRFPTGAEMAIWG